MKFTKFSLYALIMSLIFAVGPTILFFAIERTIPYLIVLIITVILAITFFMVTLFSWKMFEEHKERMSKGLERKKWNERRITEKTLALLILFFGVGIALSVSASLVMFIF